MIYHCALADDWDRALASGEYRISTLGVSLEQEGFVHTSFAAQLPAVVRRVHAGVTAPLVLLMIDESLLSSPVRVDPVAGSESGFPHVYGPIDVAAVVEVVPLLRDDDGEPVLPPLT